MPSGFMAAIILMPVLMICEVSNSNIYGGRYVIMYRLSLMRRQ
jgi:hypothetical protein